MTDTLPVPPAIAPLTFWAVVASRLLPDARGWCALAVFALTVGILQMIANNPALLSNASFMLLVGNIAGAGGLGLVLAFHFGSSTGTQKANERADRAQAIAAAGAGSSGTGDGKS